MLKNFRSKYFPSFTHILFLQFYSGEIKQFNIFVRCLLYLVSFAAFYVPVLFSIVTICMDNREYIAAFCGFTVLHIFAKFMYCNSKKIQNRFEAIKTKRKIIFKAVLVVEYVVFKWLVYLLYPITCILLPASMILVFFERFFNTQIVVNTILSHTDQFLLYGSLAACIVFIIADGYKKIGKGSMPEYLVLFAMLSASSKFMNIITQSDIMKYIPFDTEAISSFMAQIFRVSNQALGMVSSSIMFVCAVNSLYASCGLVKQETAVKGENEVKA